MYGKYAHGQDYQNNPKSNEEIEKMIDGYKFWFVKNKFSFTELMQMEKTIKQNLIVKLQKWSKVIRANLLWNARFWLAKKFWERHLVSIN